MNQNAPIILQITPALDTGGVERTAVDIGNVIVKEGWTSLVASAGGRLVSRLEAGGSEHIELPLDTKNPLTIWRNASALTRLIRSRGVDIIHARSRAPAWSALLAARRTGAKFVTTYHGAYSQKNAIKAAYNSVMARADAVIANSQWTADLIAARHPWAKERIVAIGRGTDFAEFDAASISRKRKEVQRTSWGLGPEDDRFTFLHLARLTEWKGQRVVIDAAADMLKAHPHAVFILAGDAQGRDAYLRELHEMIAGRGLEDSVVLPGHCDDPAAAVAACDCVVVASTGAEAFGRAAIEAGALEKPVIATRIGAVGETVLAEPEVAHNAITGWKVPPADPAAMAKAMADVVSMSEGERAAIGRRARIFGMAHFSLQQMCDKTLAVYRSLLA